MIRRLPLSVKEALLAVNRDAGTGGGSGAFPFVSLGAFTGSTLGTYSTANSSTWTDVAGTSFTIQVARTSQFIYLVFATAFMSVGAGKGYIRGNIVGFDTTASPFFQGGGPAGANAMIWYWPFTPGPIPPGAYTVKMQAATDNGNTISVTQGMHQVFDVGQ